MKVDVNLLNPGVNGSAALTLVVKIRRKSPVRMAEISARQSIEQVPIV